MNRIQLFSQKQFQYEFTSFLAFKQGRSHILELLSGHKNVLFLVTESVSQHSLFSSLLFPYFFLQFF